MKKLLLISCILLIPSLCFASAPSRQNTYVALFYSKFLKTMRTFYGPLMNFFNNKFKIFKAVIIFDTIFMMHLFIKRKFSPKMFFHYKTMLGKVFIRNTKTNITSLNNSSTFPIWTSFSCHIFRMCNSSTFHRTKSSLFFSNICSFYNWFTTNLTKCFNFISMSKTTAFLRTIFSSIIFECPRTSIKRFFTKKTNFHFTFSMSKIRTIPGAIFGFIKIRFVNFKFFFTNKTLFSHTSPLMIQLYHNIRGLSIKKCVCFIIITFLLTISNGYASSPSRQNTYIDGETIEAVDVTENEDEIFTYLQTGVDTYLDNSIGEPDINWGVGTNQISQDDVVDGSTYKQYNPASVAITGGSVTGITDVTVADGGTGVSTLSDGFVLLGNGTGTIQTLDVTANGGLIIGDGTTDPTTISAFTNSTGTLKHESGGLEADVSGYTDGIYGQATGATLNIDTSLEIKAAISDETGTGAMVFAGSPALTGTATAVNINASGTVTGAVGDFQNIDNSAGGVVTVRDGLTVNGTITGNLTGDLTGDVTGDLTGNVTGDVTGNVTGNLTGNADTVTTNANLTGEVTSSGNATTITDSVAVTSWNLTTPTITTSLTTSTPTTISAAELDRLDGLTGVIVTDTTACTEIDGTNLTIGTGTLNVDDPPTFTGIAGFASLDASGTVTGLTGDFARVENAGGQLTFNDTTTGVKTLAQLAAAGGAAAPTDATYITQTANGTLSAEQALDALASGIMRVDTAAGVITSLTDSNGILTNISDETGTGVMVFGTAPTITNTLLLSGATPTITVGDAGAEDAQINFSGNAQNYHFGLDDTDDALKIGLGSALGTTDHMVFSSGGIISFPLNSAANAYSAATQANIADVTFVQVVLGTEGFDVQSEFATNAFTATVSGYYLIIGQIEWGGLVDLKTYRTAIYVNDTVVFDPVWTASGTAPFGARSTTIQSVTAGQTVKLYGWADSGGTTQDMQAGLNTFLTVILLQ